MRLLLRLECGLRGRFVILTAVSAVLGGSNEGTFLNEVPYHIINFTGSGHFNGRA